MGSNFTSPPGALNLAKYRLDMFSKCTQSALKESIVSSFVNPKSRLRVVVATVAFGMGLIAHMCVKLFTGDHLKILIFTYKK